MEALKNFPEDFAETLRTSFDYLKIFNIRFLEDDQPFLKKNWRFSYVIGTIIMHGLSLSLSMAEAFKEQDMEEFSHLTPILLTCVHVIMSCTVLISKTRQISELIKELASQWRVECTTSQKQEKDKMLRRFNYINRASYWSIVCGLIIYLLSPLFITLFRRFILKQDGELLLPFASYSPLNATTNWGMYIAVYIFQIYSIILQASLYMGTLFLMITCCALLGIEFVMLRHDLAEVMPEKYSERRNDVDTDENEGPSIKSFVKRHQKLLSLSRQLDNVFKGMVFIEILFVGITVCTFTFMMQFARRLNNMIIAYDGIALLIIAILYLCYSAELLTEASASLGDTAYQSQWYNAGKHYKMAILLIITMSQKPCCLTSMGYTAVSMDLFTKVASTTWSYCSVVHTIYSSEE